MGFDFRADLFKQLLAENVSVCGPSTGTSMWPLIRADDRLVIERADPQMLRSGDVVLITVQDRLLVHRILRLTPDQEKPEPTLISKGDHCRHPDPPVSATQVLGILIAIERADRRINLYSSFRQIQARLLLTISSLGSCGYYLLHGFYFAMNPKVLLRRILGDS